MGFAQTANSNAPSPANSGGNVTLSPEQAAILAVRALAQDPENRDARRVYVRALYQGGEYQAARYHLRYLLRGPKTDAEDRYILAAVADVVRKKPLSFGGHFSLLPSTNIDKTSSNSVFDTLIGQFAIQGGGKQKSGVGARFGGNLAYEINSGPQSTITFGLGINRNIYPDRRLRRWDGIGQVSWQRLSRHGSISITPFVGRYVYDTALNGTKSDMTRKGLRFGWERVLGQERTLFGAVQFEQREYDDKGFANANVRNASLGFSDDPTARFGYSLSLGISQEIPNQVHLRNEGYEIGVEGRWRIGTSHRFSANIGFGQDRYHGQFPALGVARRDRSGAIGVSYSNTKIVVFKTSPKISCQYRRGQSNVALYEFSSTDCALSFERRF